MSTVIGSTKLKQGGIMGMMDNIQGKVTDESRERYEQLKSRIDSGSATDDERTEYNQLRGSFEGQKEAA